jgi:Ion channel
MTNETLGANRREPAHDSPAQFRYGIVFVLTLGVVVFVIAAPSANWSRATALLMDGVALVFAIATTRDREEIRRRNAAIAGLAMIVLILLAATGAAPHSVTDVANVLITAAVPVVIVGGLLRLLRERGVTVQAVAGALTIYLSLGLLFAYVIAFVTHVDSALYFAQHTDGTQGDRVYFSFTVLTTTGFGDFSAATPAGHALAVIEMLTGQLYLVTAIGLLIGNFAARRKTP